MKLAERTLSGVVYDDAPLPEEVEQHLCLDKGFDFEEIRALCWAWGYVVHMKTRGEESKAKREIEGYTPRRWVVERTHSWMNRFRRILIRWEKSVENYEAMLHLACAWIAFSRAGLFGQALSCPTATTSVTGSKNDI